VWEVVGIRLRISTASTRSGARASGAFQSHPTVDKLSPSPRKAKARTFVATNTPGLLDRGTHEERHTLLYAVIRAGCPVPRRPGSRWSRTAIGFSSVSVAGGRLPSADAVTTETCIARLVAREFSVGSLCVEPGPTTSGPGVEPGFMPPASSRGGAGGPRK